MNRGVACDSYWCELKQSLMLLLGSQQCMGFLCLISCLYKKHSVLCSVREFQQKCFRMQRCADRYGDAMVIRSRSEVFCF